MLVLTCLISVEAEVKDSILLVIAVCSAVDWFIRVLSVCCKSEVTKLSSLILLSIPLVSSLITCNIGGSVCLALIMLLRSVAKECY